MNAGRPSSWFGWLAGSAPAVGLEVSSRRVTGVRIAGRGPRARIAAHASAAVPAGAVVPALNAPNVADRDALAAAIRAVLEGVGRPRRVALVLPDTVGKVSLVRFEAMRARPRELGQLVRWQVRKAAPFAIEQAQVSWTDGVELPGGGRELVVAIVRRDIVEEYEASCRAAGAHAGLVDLATFNLVNLVTAADRADAVARAAAPDWLLVHLTPDYSTLAIVRGDRLVFYRNRLADAEGHLADLVHQTAMYYEDRLGGAGFSRVIVASAEPGQVQELAALRDTLEDRLRSPVEALDPRQAAALADRITAPPELLATLAAPVGVVLREAPAR